MLGRGIGIVSRVREGIGVVSRIREGIGVVSRVRKRNRDYLTY